MSPTTLNLPAMARAVPKAAPGMTPKATPPQMTPEAMRAQAETACRLMKVLSNPDRLLLLCQLAQGEQRVGELEQQLGISQPTLSQQLAVLRDEDLVHTRRDGKHIHYAIASAATLAVLNVLYQQFCEPPQEMLP